MSSAAVAARRLGGGHRAAAPGSHESNGLLTRLLGRASRIKPFKALATVLFSLTLVGIVANAVVFQKGRHPAPLLGTGKAVPAVQRDLATRTPEPPDAAAPPTVRSAVVPAVPAAVPADDTPSASVKRVAPKPQRVDGIGKLLHSKGAAADTELAGPASAEKKPDAALLAVQKRLAKLGYAVKPDGRMGIGTRQAVERFEHDRHLKTEVEMSPHLRREIATATPLPESATKAR